MSRNEQLGAVQPLPEPEANRSAEPTWAVMMQRDLETLVDMRLSKVSDTAPNAAQIREKLETLRTTASLETKLAFVMNNFHMYMPNGNAREQVAFLEQGAEENDEALLQVIAKRKMVFAEIDHAIAAFGIPEADVAAMKNYLTMDKTSEDFQRVVRSLGDIFYRLRAEGFEIKDLNT